jgi:hypothetical protein
LKIEDGDCLSFDACWDHRRHGGKLLDSMISLVLRKVVTFHILEKKSVLSDDFKGESGLMEHFAFDKMLPFYRYRKIKTFVSDGDLKVWKE